jgi:hypothetical protein
LWQIEHSWVLPLVLVVVAGVVEVEGFSAAVVDSEEDFL